MKRTKEESLTPFYKASCVPLYFHGPIQIVGWSVEGSLQNGKPCAAWWADGATRAIPAVPDGWPLCRRQTQRILYPVTRQEPLFYPFMLFVLFMVNSDPYSFLGSRRGIRKIAGKRGVRTESRKKGRLFLGGAVGRLFGVGLLAGGWVGPPKGRFYHFFSLFPK